MADWPAEIQADFKRNAHNPCVGQVLVLENEQVRVWTQAYGPGEAVPFHRHVLNYFWTCMSAGRGRQYFSDGRIVDMDYEEGDTKQLNYGAGEFMLHNSMNIGDSVLKFITVEFLDSPNSPLALPPDVKRKPTVT